MSLCVRVWCVCVWCACVLDCFVLQQTDLLAWKYVVVIRMFIIISIFCKGALQCTALIRLWGEWSGRYLGNLKKTSSISPWIFSNSPHPPHERYYIKAVDSISLPSVIVCLVYPWIISMLCVCVRTCVCVCICVCVCVHTSLSLQSTKVLLCYYRHYDILFVTL